MIEIKLKQGIKIISDLSSILLVANRDRAHHALLSAALADLARPIVENVGVAQALVAGPCVPALIVVDLDAPALDGPALASGIRALDGPGATVPILGATDRLDMVQPSGFDAVLNAASALEALTTVVASWLPHGDGRIGARLAALFGEAEIGPLVAALRDQLAAAVARLDELGACAYADRVAGLAGMLDLPDVHRAWLALSDGDESAAPDARRLARVAVAAIDRACLCER